MRFITIIGNIICIVGLFVACIGCSTAPPEPSPIPMGKQETPESPTTPRPTPTERQPTATPAAPDPTASAVIPTASVAETAVGSPLPPTGTPVPPTGTPAPTAAVRPTPIPTISAAYAPPIPSDVPVPTFDSDLLSMIATVVQCRFPNAVYDPELHRDAMIDILRRETYGNSTDEFLLAVPYYVRVLGLKYAVFGINTGVLREAVRQRWSCTDILARLNEIWYEPDRFSVPPSFFSLFHGQEVYGWLTVSMAYE
ncbi:hypothetical protein [Chloroflexus sp. MS-G]|uniref:hypothetical protein n=1 Tax=Chloroflexus sp. MS-G TaxID=1521187 RepID=UPI0004DED331|nr:hypothetical protein [Chloroflexus sp. MS-G]